MGTGTGLETVGVMGTVMGMGTGTAFGTGTVRVSRGHSGRAGGRDNAGHGHRDRSRGGGGGDGDRAGRRWVPGRDGNTQK